MVMPTIAELQKFLNRKADLLSIGVNSTAAQAAQIMSAHGIGCLVVFDEDQQFVGILSERDMLIKVYANCQAPPDKVMVNDIMTSSVISCTSETSIAEAEKLMAEHRIRHLPVLENGKPIEMISTRDMMAYQLENSKAMQVAAEELAMLPTGLKSLDFNDVVSMAINDVPKHLGAEGAALCFAEDDLKRLKVFRNGCECSKNELSKHLGDLNESESLQTVISQPCLDCDNACDQTHRFIIPLSIQDHSDTSDVQNIPGFLCVCHGNSPASADEAKVYKATLLQQMLNANLTNARLYNSYEKARHDSETDPLTGVGTRRILENVLKAECARALRYGCDFSVAIADLDNFKTINDSAGHAIGDKTLKELAELMRQSTRDTDIVITRFGGDEFVLILPETKLSGAEILMNRIRKKFNDLSVPGIEHLSISSGVVQWSSQSPDTPESIMKRADTALYEAKERGRNCVVAHSNDVVSC